MRAERAPPNLVYSPIKSTVVDTEHFMTRSEVAADLSLVELVKDKPFCFLWTFTFTEATSAKDAGRCWNKLLLYAARNKIKFKGLKVYEKHPGGHGIHIHMVTPEYYNVNDIRPLAEAAGFGRIHAKRISSSRAGYVLKYVRKGLRKGIEGLEGVRKWSVFGDAREWATRKKDIVVDTLFTRCWHWLKTTNEMFPKLPYFAKRQMVEGTIWNGIASGNQPWEDHWHFDAEGEFTRHCNPF
jgi:hypothetical protein